MPKIPLHGLDKAEVLAALYNASRPVGTGVSQYDPTPMTPNEGKHLLENNYYFDYIRGRVLKLDFSKEELETCLYDRDNGEGAAAKVISELRKKPNDGPNEVTQCLKWG
jgi:hypothetical protein